MQVNWQQQVKMLGLSNRPADVYKDVSLINHAFVFYVVA